MSGSEIQKLPRNLSIGRYSDDVKVCISDAAGAAVKWEKNVCINVTVRGDRGVAAVGFEKETVTTVGIIRWPEHLLTRYRAQGGAYFGSRSVTLEMVGLLIPFLI